MIFFCFRWSMKFEVFSIRGLQVFENHRNCFNVCSRPPFASTLWFGVISIRGLNSRVGPRCPCVFVLVLVANVGFPSGASSSEAKLLCKFVLLSVSVVMGDLRSLSSDHLLMMNAGVPKRSLLLLLGMLHVVSLFRAISCCLTGCAGSKCVPSVLMNARVPTQS